MHTESISFPQLSVSVKLTSLLQSISWKRLFVGQKWKLGVFCLVKSHLDSSWLTQTDRTHHFLFILLHLLNFNTLHLLVYDLTCSLPLFKHCQPLLKQDTPHSIPTRCTSDSCMGGTWFYNSVSVPFMGSSLLSSWVKFHFYEIDSCPAVFSQSFSA